MEGDKGNIWILSVEIKIIIIPDVFMCGDAIYKVLSKGLQYGRNPTRNGTFIMGGKPSITDDIDVAL
jgi:hypothetical protein